jgi:hypothetical protein
MLGDAVTRIREDDGVAYLIGGSDICKRPLQPYHDEACEFLSDLSEQLAKVKSLENSTDVSAFAFWCRRRNIEQLKNRYSDGTVRLGRGLMFHITPTNVPVNFAYSFAFGLLSGNANIVRVPTQTFPQIDIICDVISYLFGTGKYPEISTMNAFVRYESGNATTEQFSRECDGRIIWGGDETIANIRRYRMPAHSVEITFADRYSFCLMDSKAVAELETHNLIKLARQFYNDTYFMDQNACSTPHLVVWVGAETKLAQDRFWTAIHEQVKNNYEFDVGVSYKKYAQVCRDAIELDCVSEITRYDNHLYRLCIEKLPSDVERLRGQFGYFFEYCTDDIDVLVDIVNEKYQTLTYFGIKAGFMKDFVIKNRLTGIDRIVPVGRALDIDIIWDGYDIVKTLSRVVTGES